MHVNYNFKYVLSWIYQFSLNMIRNELFFKFSSVILLLLALSGAGFCDIVQFKFIKSIKFIKFIGLSLSNK